MTSTTRPSWLFRTLSPEKLFTYLTALLALRFVFTTLRSFLAPMNPHIWRQADTLGVTLRYWLRWAAEPQATLPLLPAVLSSQDTQGLMPQEFPLLNILLAPAYALGPYGGRTLAQFLLFSGVLLLTFLVARVWKDKKILGIDGPLMVLAVPIFSFGLTFSNRFMPDTFALLVLLAAMGLSWNKPRYLLSFLLATLALCIRPPIVIALALCMALPPHLWARHALWILPALGSMVFYFKFLMAEMDTLREIPIVFNLAKPVSLNNFILFFSHPRDLFDLFLDQFMPLLAAPLVLFLFVTRASFARLFPQALLAHSNDKASRNGEALLWFIALLQVCAIAFLNGDHTYVHRYYLMGTTPIFALLFWNAWANYGTSIRAVLGVLFLITYFTDSTNSIRGFWKAEAHSESFVLTKECQDLKTKHPAFPWNQGYVFRTAPENHPDLGLCFGEREQSQHSSFGFFRNGKALPEDCKEVDKGNLISLVCCGNGCGEIKMDGN